uniref:Uncharacterized protein n=1 Tax=Corethron hystrix TaxID=216773 RepID=A0A7S1BN97_9STRA|mmetsp:Transcript_32433/g.74665  ORF Transcript_32433/g.74665 Transcript_32433/m.74665 type:complete len:126 (+) Transcript_32433:71-448(+)
MSESGDVTQRSDERNIYQEPDGPYNANDDCYLLGVSFISEENASECRDENDADLQKLWKLREMDSLSSTRDESEFVSNEPSGCRKKKNRDQSSIGRKRKKCLSKCGDYICTEEKQSKLLKDSQNL